MPVISETVLPRHLQGWAKRHLQSLQWEVDPAHTCPSEAPSLPSGPSLPAAHLPPSGPALPAAPPSPPLTSLVLCRHLASMS